VNREKDAKPVDMSQLRQPIRLGGSALDQVLNAVHYGSPEMRSLLQVECSFIFECKVCRGLFRDLPNFISHKRVFCDKSVLDEQWINLAQIPEEEVFVVESAAAEETRPGRFKEPSWSRHSLEDTVLRLQARNADKTNALSVYTRALEKVQKQSENIKVTTIKTTPIPTNSNAVFVDITTKSKQRDGSEPVDGMKESSMYSSKEENIGRKSGDTQKQSRRKGLPSSKGDRGDTMQRTSKSVEDRKLSRKKDEPKICRREEKQRLNRRREVRLQDDGKLSDKNEQSSDNEAEETENHPLMCKKCNKVYATKSTLNLHIGIAHSDTRTYYPCTLCKKIFSGLQCVMRHMHVLHNMPMQKVYQMRDKLKKEAFTKPV
ncbi:hypothetical protein EGW08_016321, partial [Elysia chlorotica]